MQAHIFYGLNAHTYYKRYFHEVLSKTNICLLFQRMFFLIPGTISQAVAVTHVFHDSIVLRHVRTNSNTANDELNKNNTTNDET